MCKEYSHGIGRTSYNTAYTVRAFFSAGFAQPESPHPSLPLVSLRHIIPVANFVYAGTLYEIRLGTNIINNMKFQPTAAKTILSLFIGFIAGLVLALKFRTTIICGFVKCEELVQTANNFILSVLFYSLVFVAVIYLVWSLAQKK